MSTGSAELMATVRARGGRGGSGGVAITAPAPSYADAGASGTSCSCEASQAGLGKSVFGGDGRFGGGGGLGFGPPVMQQLRHHREIPHQGHKGVREARGHSFGRLQSDAYFSPRPYPFRVPLFPGFLYLRSGGLINSAMQEAAGSSAAAGGAAGAGSRSSKRTKICRQFERSGTCRFGDTCKFTRRRSRRPAGPAATVAARIAGERRGVVNRRVPPPPPRPSLPPPLATKGSEPSHPVAAVAAVGAVELLAVAVTVYLDPRANRGAGPAPRGGEGRLLVLWGPWFRQWTRSSYVRGGYCVVPGSWARRSSIFVPESWPRVRPRIRCAVVSTNFLVGLEVLVCFSADDWRAEVSLGGRARDRACAVVEHETLHVQW